MKFFEGLEALKFGMKGVRRLDRVCVMRYSVNFIVSSFVTVLLLDYNAQKSHEICRDSAN